MTLGVVVRYVVLGVAFFFPATGLAQGFQITPGVQAELDKKKEAVTRWAADPVIVAAVKEQNGKGPIAGMDNPAWKTTRRSDPVVKGFQANAAGQYLKGRVQDSSGEFAEAFLRNYPTGSWIVRERDRLTSAIDRAAGEGSADDGGSR